MKHSGTDVPQIDGVVVVVPAHNEAQLLPHSLAGLLTAATRTDVPVRVVVVLDGCDDQSRLVVGDAATVLVIDDHSVGSARAAGFNSVRGDVTDHTWFLSTDADSVVPQDWIADHLQLARSGARVVCGTVRVDDWTGVDDVTRQSYEYLYRPRDGHRHIHGANLGVLARDYWAVGGFAPLETGEDVDLVRRLRHAGVPITWSGAVPVPTSARTIGRAPDGFATYLRQLSSKAAS